MTLLHRLASIVRWIARRKDAEADLADDIQHFVDMAAADHVRAGMTPADARRLALMDVGGVEQAKEHVRTGRHGAWLDDIGCDVRYAARLAIRNPGFSVVIVLTLALGIGANTAIFSLIDALLLRSLPVRDPQQLVQVKMGEASHPAVHFSYPIARALADRRDVFSTAAGFSAWTFNVGPAGSVGRVTGALVTGAFYETLGLRPVIGRLLISSDDEPGAPLVAVISYGYWERQFVSRQDVVGETLTIGGLPVTIVGVSPRGFVGATVGDIANITLPVAAIARIQPDQARLLERGNFWLRILARTAAGISTTQATARLNALWPQIWDSLIAPQWPAKMRKTMADAVFELSPGGTGWTILRDRYTKPLAVLMGAVALVLLIACGNVASLLLARASVRQHEIALRMAIGASSARVARQLLIESSLLSMTGAMFGLALAWLSGRLLVSLISTGPRGVILDLTPNTHILGFTALLALATGIGFGTAPAFRATRAAPSSALKSDSRTSGSSSRLLSPLVAGQVALTLILLVAAGLFVRTLQNLEAVDLGFRSEGVLMVDLESSPNGVPVDILDDVRRLPGVVAASASTHTPLNGAIWSEPAVPAGQPLPERDNSLFVGASPGFFETMQIRQLGGRDFSDRDTRERPAVAIVNHAFARRGFANQNPIGQHLSATVRGERKDLEIVGLVENTYNVGLRMAPRPIVYVAYSQLPGTVAATLTIRAVGSLSEISSAIQRAVQAKRPSSPIEVRPLSAQVNGAIVQERMLATLAGGFGLLALVLACVGVYGLLAYGVAQRIKEIGIRLALGAERRRVVRLVLGRAARLVLIGVAIGWPVAFAASRWIESLLFGLKSTDLPTMASAIVLLALTAQIAAWVPAWRASRVNPLAALRHD